MITHKGAAAGSGRAQCHACHRAGQQLCTTQVRQQRSSTPCSIIMQAHLEVQVRQQRSTLLTLCFDQFSTQAHLEVHQHLWVHGRHVPNLHHVRPLARLLQLCDLEPPRHLALLLGQLAALVPLLPLAVLPCLAATAAAATRLALAAGLASCGMESRWDGNEDGLVGREWPKSGGQVQRLSAGHAHKAVCMAGSIELQSCMLQDDKQVQAQHPAHAPAVTTACKQSGLEQAAP